MNMFQIPLYGQFLPFTAGNERDKNKSSRNGEADMRLKLWLTNWTSSSYLYT